MKVSFYELAAKADHATDSDAQGNIDDVLSEKGIALIAEFYSKRQYLTLVCADKTQAEWVDEYIWRQPAERFIAHNLQGEGPKNGSPVEITWLEQLDTHPVRNKKVVINLAECHLAQFAAFHHLIDFVPSDEARKAQARERYKQYKQAGCDMRFINA
ncbi:DNA polymerase III subunit chi [Ningiella sp. W23]|uniref:DNA polymerase III subunit chi n=1 Tax=Ningiella sp. W23 TaxID=3023715 RepID=UPI003757958A